MIYNHPLLLEDFVVAQERKLVVKNNRPSGAFSTLLMRIALISKLIRISIARAGIDKHLGLAGYNNAHGDAVKVLDAEVEAIFERILTQLPQLHMFASEERDRPVSVFEDGDYAVVFDPIDGSSNIETGWLLGSTFGIYHKVFSKPFDPQNILQTPSQMIAAGYVMYGTRTIFVYTTGNGVHHFELHPDINEFVLINEQIVIPPGGRLLSANLAYLEKWDQWVKDYVHELLKSEQYSLRYSGTLVADVHRLLAQGGIFIYPDAKLRRPYEVDVMAAIVRQAGGFTFNGVDELTNTAPHYLHQRTPFFAFGEDHIGAFFQFAPHKTS